jgi:hypothetical protein
MIPQIKDLQDVRVFADSNYDSHRMHKDIFARGGRLITKLRKGGAKKRQGAGHEVTRRQMGEARRGMIDLWLRHPRLMLKLCQKRGHIERVFAWLSCWTGLLSPLPWFVRGLARVSRWVGAKISLYHALLKLKKAKV